MKKKKQKQILYKKGQEVSEVWTGVTWSGDDSAAAFLDKVKVT